MAGKEPDTGPTALTVAANIRRLRTAQNLTYTQLSERLKDAADWSITPVGVRRIEEGQRRVSVDDLVALAVALGKSPALLLMPDTLTPEVRVAATGTGKQAADRLWEWLCGLEPLSGSGMNWATFRAGTWPEWKWEQFSAGEELQRRRREFDAEITRRRAYAAKRKADSGDD